MDPATLASLLQLADIVVRNPQVQRVAGNFWALLTETRQAPTMTELLTQQKNLAVAMAEPTFSTDFPDYMDYYEMLLLATTLVTRIRTHGCLYQDFYSGKDSVYFPPPVEAPSIGTIGTDRNPCQGVIADGRGYQFYLLIEPKPSIDELHEFVEAAAVPQEEPESFLDKLKDLKVEYKPLYGISTGGGKHQFCVDDFMRTAINMRGLLDPATPKRISQDLLNLIDRGMESLPS